MEIIDNATGNVNPRPQARAQFLRYLVKIGVENDMANGTQLRRLLDVSDSDFATKRAAVMFAIKSALHGDEAPERALTHCPRCSETPRAPSLDIQLANFTRWQHAQPGVYHWSDDEMQTLRAAMQPGDMLHPAFAKSVYIRRADGSFVLYERSK